MEDITFETEGAVGLLRINKPQALNALNSAMLEELSHFFSHKHPIRVLIITGTGDKAFIAGADIREMAAMNATDSHHFCALGQHVTLMLEQSPYVTIAAVNGFALGGGLEIALACDFIYASTNALMGLPEVSLGVIPGFGGTQRLTRAVGTRMAKELIFTGRKVNAEEAKAIGLANHVCEPDTLLDTCRATAAQIVKNSACSIQRAKKVIDNGYDLSLTDALHEEQSAFAECFKTADRREGMTAFLEKRLPQFQGVNGC